MKTAQVPPSLVYVTDEMPGYFRYKNGVGFIYKNESGRKIKGRKTIQRIEKLTIPPMWKKVWICKNPKGHIQATGRDEKGRKQYIYHQRWQKYISKTKYNKLLSFAESLPAIRKKVDQDLKQTDWTKTKVTALAIKLMDKLYLRIGNKHYEEENGTYGITTLRRKHIFENEKHLEIKFKGKSGKFKYASINHPTLKKLLKECSELPGYELFRYKTAEKYKTLKSEDVNRYLQEISEKEITAKNFRTWGGTVLTLKLETKARKICAENPRKTMDATLVRLVSKELNNTIAVSRKYYIHPKILQIATEGKIANYQTEDNIDSEQWYSKYERMAISILKQAAN